MLLGLTIICATIVLLYICTIIDSYLKRKQFNAICGRPNKTIIDLEKQEENKNEN